MKRSIALLLALLMLLGLTACGDVGSDVPIPKVTPVGDVAQPLGENMYYVLVSEKIDSAEVQYTYDQYGNILTKKVTEGDGDTKSYTYTYDTQGNRLTEVFVNQRGEQTTTTYTYDTNGNCLTETSEKGTISYTYDTAGNCLTKNGLYGENTRYTYDGSGKVLTAQSTYQSGEYQNLHYRYDAQGRCVMLESTDSISGYTKATYAYDEKGRMTEEIIDNGSTTDRYVFEYDANGNRSKESWYYDGSLREVTEYTWQAISCPNGYQGDEFFAPREIGMSY